MRGRAIFDWFACAGCVLATSLSATQLQAAVPDKISTKLAQTTVPFIRNDGHLDAAVAFHATTFGGQVFVTRDDKLVYDLPTVNQKGQGVSWVFREVFVNQSLAAAQGSGPAGLEPSSIAVSRFKDRQPENWKSRLASFNRVSLGEPFPGVRVQLKAAGNNIEKLFYVAAGANPDNINIIIEGVNAVAVNDEAQLVLSTDLGDIIFTRPVAYQLIEGERKAVPVQYALNENLPAQYGFKLGPYDTNHELVIDPLLASTYVGGVNNNPAWVGNYDEDIAYAVLTFGDTVYLGGVTQSTDFPVQLGYDESPDAFGRPDGFLARLSGDLSTLYSATYIGTDYFDRVSAIAMDADGSIVAVGQAGYGFPVTPGAYTYSGTTPVGGGFVAKFSADLSSLVASAVVTPSDYPTELAIGNGGIYFAGRTNNPGFPVTSNAFLTTCCPSSGSYGVRAFDGFAGKISSDLTTLDAMTYLGGEIVTGIAVAADNSVYITDGGDGVSGYLARFDGDLTTRFAKVSYYPGTSSGSSRHYFNDVAVGDNFVIAAGQTYLNDLPVSTGAYDTSCGSDGDCNNISSTLYIPKPDGFIAKYSTDLQTLQAMTYFGGNDGEAIRTLALDAAGNVYVAGETLSTDMPTTAGAFDRNLQLGNADVFVAKLSNDLSQLLYGSYLGGSTQDYAYQLSLGMNDTLYVAGRTNSTDFPTTGGAFDRSYGGGTQDAFVSQFDMSGVGGGGSDPGPAPVPDPAPNEVPVADAGPDQSAGSRERVYLDGSGSYDRDGTIAYHSWRQVSGKSVSINNAQAAIANFRAPRLRKGRTYTLVFELSVTDDQGASATDELIIIVQ